jgi:hypothetical protein
VDIGAIAMTEEYILRREPQLISAGDKVVWLRQIEEYPATDWTLKYVIRNRENIYKFDATNDSGLFKVTLETATTSTWKKGVYAIGAYVTDGTSQHEVRTFFTRLSITANLAIQPQGIETLSWAARTLPLIESTISALSGRTVESASVNGQMYSLANIGDLFKMRERLKSEVLREESKARLDAGLGAGNKIGVRFRRVRNLGFPAYPLVPWM